MNSQIYIEKISKIISSKNFIDELKIHADNFPNLKLENQIRNALVIQFNKLFDNDLRAFAEYPRFVLENKSRISVDFSVCDNKRLDFTMEMKYSFPNDHKQMTNYANIIRKDILNRKYGNGLSDLVDAFMVIICETDKGKLVEFERSFTTNLNSTSQYQLSSRSIKGKVDWEARLKNSFEIIKMEAISKGQLLELKELEPIKIKTIDELDLKFYFYLLYRK